MSDASSCGLALPMREISARSSSASSWYLFSRRVYDSSRRFASARSDSFSFSASSYLARISSWSSASCDMSAPPGVTVAPEPFRVTRKFEPERPDADGPRFGGEGEGVRAAPDFVSPISSFMLARSSAERASIFFREVDILVAPLPAGGELCLRVGRAALALRARQLQR